MPDIGNGREPMLDMFLFETTQLIEQLEEIIIRCEKSKKLEPGDINEIFRIMHTVKGSSAMMMFNHVSAVAHSLEDLFYYIREDKKAKFAFEALSDLVLLGIDFIKNQVEKIENGSTADEPADALISKIKSHLISMKGNDGERHQSEAITAQTQSQKKYYISNYESVQSEKKVNKYAARIHFTEDCQMENIRAYMVVHNIKELSTELFHTPEDIIDNNESAQIIKEQGFLLGFSTDSSESEVEGALKQTAFLRSLELKKVDEYPKEIRTKYSKIKISLEENEAEPPINACVDMTEKEEFAATKAGKQQQNIISVNVSKLDILMDLVGEIVISEAMVTRNSELEGLQLDSFNKASRQLRKLTDELQDIVMSIRMVPVMISFNKMNRIVRDMSKKLDKEVELELIGEETEVDKNIIDHLSDPLMHLIRNSLDHGIESREERIRAGKPAKGKITLEAKNAGGDVWIIVKDDGKGLDREKILKKAREQGLVTKTDSELSDKEVFSYILLPGFSTKEKVTEFSGRGVGMDVVKKNIDNIGGNISIESSIGKGTTIVIKIPLTLAIIDGMEIGVGKARYTIPITAIKESFKVKEENVISDPDGNEMVMIRGRSYPVIRIHKAFNVKTDIISISDGIMIMVEGDSRSACLFADQLLGEQQVVVKVLPRYLKRVQGIAGCTILGDGCISLIIDVNGLLEK